ncbi:ATP-grasp domain-containing protein [uncultured Acinetobacter sp.]|uniref:ATP-grasp domain-containing protein n=1 Tax=uncultured Acinetobacter sp. TaxID=165433 RepID=UPI002582BB3A|nr:ATP-grasp domain-containing protein [uncultured Acinetobacter sp.]
MTQIVNDLAQMDIAENSIGIWFTQAHSCQRDLILAAKNAPFNLPIHVVASHAEDRPEITSVADIALQEPPFSERVEWVLQQAQRLNVKLIIAGHHAAIYLAEKHRFEQLGIRLMAGCDTLDQIEQLNDKSLFTQICLNHSLAVAPATIVENAEQLQDAYHDWRQKGEVCVKPAKGVFASGFWHLDPSANSFDVFANSMRFKAHPESFIESYRQLEKPPVYLVMPFLSGLECSVDMLCIHGQVHGAIARYKQKNGCQNLTFEDPAIELAYQVAALFGCDGLVNMQARYNDQQQLYILEVNSRPSGGIAHTFMSGVNLVHLAIAHTLQLHYQPKKTEGSLIVRSISQSICVI